MNDFERAGLQLEHIEQAIEGSLADAADAGAGVFVGGAKRRAARLTGRMAEHITKKRLKGQKGVGQSKVFVGAFYAKFVEYGTSRTRARPFMRPTLDEDGDKIAAAMERTILRAAARARDAA